MIVSHSGKVSSFEGLTMIVQDGATYYDWMKAAYGLTDAQRQPYTFNAASFLVNEASAMQGYLSSGPYAIETEIGMKSDIWLIADAGFRAYSTAIQATPATITDKPDVVICFVEGSIAG